MVVFIIREGLLLGSENDALMVDRRRKSSKTGVSVTHILSITNHRPYWEKACVSGEIKTLHVEAKDLPSSDLLHHFSICISFIEEARTSGGCVLVHCMYGVSRSPTIIVAYLMKSENLSCKAALQSVTDKKPSVKPNAGFMKQLGLWESMKCSIDPTHSAMKGYRLKAMAKEMTEQGRITSLHVSPNPSGTGDDVVYKCRKCRRSLFTNENVLFHNAGTGLSSIRGQTPQLPASNGSSTVSEQPAITPPASSDDTTDVSIQVSRGIEQLTISKQCTPTNEASAPDLEQRNPIAIQSESSHQNDETFFVPLIPSSSQPLPQPTTTKPSVLTVSCTSLFIDTVEWLTPTLVGQLEGKILCPKCNGRLGSFNWSGGRCSCGQWITPSFQVHKSRVDHCIPPTIPLLTHSTTNTPAL